MSLRKNWEGSCDVEDHGTCHTYSFQQKMHDLEELCDISLCRYAVQDERDIVPFLEMENDNRRILDRKVRFNNTPAQDDPCT